MEFETNLLSHNSAKRHTEIKKIIEKQSVTNQSELSDELKKKGFLVTQSVISKDLRKIGIKKNKQSKVYELIKEDPQYHIHELYKLMESNPLYKNDIELLVIETPIAQAQLVTYHIEKAFNKIIIGTLLLNIDTVVVFINKTKTEEHEKIWYDFCNLFLKNYDSV